MRLWPRGIAKGKVDRWMKELGCERDLIKKWKSGNIDWDDFKKEYRNSLKGKEDLLKDLAAESEKEDITLLCTDRDASRCHRSLLAEELKKYLRKE
jgi:uncharacterized protein YeaO (DUF488 family)